jgi:haloalkane dehalogenase
MHYIDHGNGEPFLFVHGIPTWSFLYRNLIRGLSQEYRCIAPDLIGFGLSEKPVDFSQSPLSHCHNLTRLIDHLGLDGITLVLHNYGGPIGLSYAIDHPERIRRIILFNTWMYDLGGDHAIEKACRPIGGPMGHMLFVNMNQAPRAALSLASDRKHVTPEFVNALRGPYESKAARENAWLAAKHVLDSGAFFADLWMSREKLLGKPMLLVWGTKDPLWGEKHLNKIWHEFPLAEVEKFSDSGHFPMEEKPAQVYGVVQKFASGASKMIV